MQCARLHGIDLIRFDPERQFDGPAFEQRGGHLVHGNVAQFDHRFIADASVDLKRIACDLIPDIDIMDAVRSQCRRIRHFRAREVCLLAGGGVRSPVEHRPQRLVDLVKHGVACLDRQLQIAGRHPLIAMLVRARIPGIESRDLSG